MPIDPMASMQRVAQLMNDLTTYGGYDDIVDWCRKNDAAQTIGVPTVDDAHKLQLVHFYLTRHTDLMLNGDLGKHFEQIKQWCDLSGICFNRQVANIDELTNDEILDYFLDCTTYLICFEYEILELPRIYKFNYVRRVIDDIRNMCLQPHTAPFPRAKAISAMRDYYDRKSAANTVSNTRFKAAAQQEHDTHQNLNGLFQNGSYYTVEVVHQNTYQSKRPIHDPTVITPSLYGTRFNPQRYADLSDIIIDIATCLDVYNTEEINDADFLNQLSTNRNYIAITKGIEKHLTLIQQWYEEASGKQPSTSSRMLTYYLNSTMSLVCNESRILDAIIDSSANETVVLPPNYRLLYATDLYRCEAQRHVQVHTNNLRKMRHYYKKWHNSRP